MQAINVTPGVPNTARSAIEAFTEVDPYYPDRNLQITGVTRDSTGAALGNCVVHLMDTTTDLVWTSTTSDASGNFTVQINKGLSQPQITTWYLVAYKPGSPDVAGTTVNTLTGA